MRLICLGLRNEPKARTEATHPRGEQDRPKAAIYASSNLNIWKLSQFTDADLATTLWKTGKDDLPEIIVASLYLDIGAHDVIPPIFTRLVRH